MSIPLVSFFVSLLGIIMMIWHKLSLFKKGVIEDSKLSHPFAIDIEKIKYFTSKGAKKLRYGLLFVALKSSIKTSNFLKAKWSVFTSWLKIKMM